VIRLLLFVIVSQLIKPSLCGGSVSVDFIFYDNAITSVPLVSLCSTCQREKV
jgi:hypothetical protein